MAKLNLGKMFLNVVPHSSDLQALCGVYLTRYGVTIKEVETVACEVWQHAAMGLKQSPCQVVQGMMAAEELIRDIQETLQIPFY